MVFTSEVVKTKHGTDPCTSFSLGLWLWLRGTMAFSETCFFLFFYGEKNGAGSGFQFQLWAPNSLVYLGALRSALALWPWQQV